MDSYLSQTICQTCGDDVYVQSFSDYFKSKENRLLDKVRIISNIIDDPTYTIASEYGFTSHTPILLSNMDGFTLETLSTALQEEEDSITTLQNNEIPIDSILDDINGQVQEIEVLVASLDALNIDTDDTSLKLTSFTSRIQGILTNATGNLKELADRIITIMSSSAPIREKVASIVNYNGAESMNAATDYTEFYSAVQNSTSMECTGKNPLAIIGGGVIDAISDEENWTNFLKGVKNVFTQIGKACVKTWNYVKDNVANMALNVTRKVLDWTTVTQNDFASKSGGDGSVENAFVSTIIDKWTYDFDFYMQNRLKDRLGLGWGTGLSINDQHVGFQDLFTMWHAKATPGEWSTHDIPGARIFLAAYPDDENNATNIRIRFKPIDPDSILYNDIDMDAPLGKVFINLTNSSASFNPTTDGQAAFQDEYFFNACRYGKAVSYMFCYYAINGQLDQSLNQLGISEANFKLGLTGLAATYWGYDSGSTQKSNGKINLSDTVNSITIGDDTYLDPTNLNFVNTLSQFTAWNAIDHDCTTGSAVYNTADAKYSDFAAIVGMYMSVSLIQEFSDQEDDGFCPYIKSTSLSAGSYYIKSDDDHIATALTRTAAVVAAIAVTAIAAKGLTFRKHIRQAALDSNIRASVIQSRYAEMIVKGIEPGPGFKDSMYKLTKKAVWLNKLSGGFASVTTGLATFGSGQLIGSATSNTTEVDNVAKLITG